MKNTGILWANDSNKDRAKAIIGNVLRMGVKNTIVSNYDGRDFPKVAAGFDRVLVDAPCAGLGVISRDPAIKTQKVVLAGSALFSMIAAIAHQHCSLSTTGFGRYSKVRQPAAAAVACGHRCHRRQVQDRRLHCVLDLLHLGRGERSHRGLCVAESRRQAGRHGPDVRSAGLHQVPTPSLPSAALCVPPLLSAHAQHGRLLCCQAQEVEQQDPGWSGRRNRHCGRRSRSKGPAIGQG